VWQAKKSDNNKRSSSQGGEAQGEGGDQNENRSEASEDRKNLPVGAVAYILVLRFLLWPLASISAIYLLASRTELVGDDPMLWFALMLMPTGPPAMKLITLVQVSNADDEDETSIAKLLTVSPRP